MITGRLRLAFATVAAIYGGRGGDDGGGDDGGGDGGGGAGGPVSPKTVSNLLKASTSSISNARSISERSACIAQLITIDW